MADNPFEIPQQLRDLTEQNMKQAHAACEQLAHFMIKAMGAWTDALPANPMAAVFKDAQGRAMEIAMENSESVFTFAGRISSAQTFQDIVTLQTQFAQDRMQAFITQTRQLYSLIEDALQKSERGAMGAGMSATPSNAIVTGFEDVQDRAVAMVKENSNSAFAPAEGIAKAQNFPAPSDREKPPRRKSAKSKTATSGTSTTPPLPSPTPPNPRRSPRSKPKAAKKEAAARGATSLKEE